MMNIKEGERLVCSITADDRYGFAMVEDQDGDLKLISLFIYDRLTGERRGKAGLSPHENGWCIERHEWLELAHGLIAYVMREQLEDADAE